MKKAYILMILAGLFVVPAFAQHPPQDKNWKDDFKDKFETFDYGLWRKANNHIHGNYEYGNPEVQNEEPQVYDSTNVDVVNEKLVLTTKKQKHLCPKGWGIENCQYGGMHDYTSGQISSRKDYPYGYYEIYAKLPASSGYWPAFWLWQSSSEAPNCWYNEIDIFEAEGCNTNVITNTVWYGFDCPASNDFSIGGHTVAATNYNNGYHWYGVEWDRDKITWYIDRKTVRQEINNMGGIGIQNPMRIIMNVALRPLSWSDCLPDSATTIFPNYMYVDQANGYQLNCESSHQVVNDLYETVNVANFSGVKKSITLSDRTVIPITGTTPSKANDPGSSLESSLNPQYALRATDFIELKPGFEVRVGSNLYLDINPCERETEE